MIVMRLGRRVIAIAIVVGYFLIELVVANFRVAYDIVTVKHFMRPAILAVPLEARTDFEIALLANLISLTPGTLSLDVSSDRKFLFVHAMYLTEPADLKRFEALLLRAIR